MGILRDLSRAIKGLFRSERAGEMCPRCGKEELTVRRERVYTGLIEREDGGYGRPASFESGDSSVIYETREQILCARCGYRGRAILVIDDGESER